MDLFIIGGLGYLGYKLNSQGITPRNKTNVRNCMAPADLPSGKNVYYSTSTKEAQADERKKMNVLYEKSKDPGKTGIIPPLWNTVCKSNCKQPIVRKTDVLDKYTSLPQATKKFDMSEYYHKKLNGPLFKKKLATDVSSKETFQVGPLPFNANGNTKVSKITGMPIDNKPIPGMVPNFSEKMNPDIRKDQFKSRLNLFTGSNEVKPKKQVIKEFFAPVPYDTTPGPTLSQTISKDRFYQSNNKNGLTPFPSIKVQPIDPMYIRVKEKTVDELRSLNNPKSVIKGRHNIGANPTEYRRGISGMNTRNGPDKFVIYNSIEDAHTQVTGPNQKPTARSITEYNRQANRVQQGYWGNAGQEEGLQQGYADNYHNQITKLLTSNKNTTIDKPHFGAGYMSGFDNVRVKPMVYDQERDTTNREYIPNAGFDTFGTYIQDVTPAKTTNREGNSVEYFGNATDYNKGVLNYNSEVTKFKDTIDYTYTPNAQFTQFGEQNRNLNYEIGTHKADQIYYREPAGQKENIMVSHSGINIIQREQKVDYENNRIGNAGFDGFSQVIRSENSRGDKHDRCDTQVDRIDPILTSSLNSNPYVIR